ncbi:hypothetical protein Tco_1085927, partial [Tanacetum coccineum]
RTFISDERQSLELQCFKPQSQKGHQVQMDEPTSIFKSERVSSWEIETYTSPVPTSLVQPMTPKNKRPQSPTNNPIVGNMRKIPAAMIAAPKRKRGRTPNLQPKILDTQVTGCIEEYEKTPEGNFSELLKSIEEYKKTPEAQSIAGPTAV